MAKNNKVFHQALSHFFTLLDLSISSDVLVEVQLQQEGNTITL